MNEHLILKEMPQYLRPYEKCEMYGSASLTDTELLAILLRSGTEKHTALEVADEVLSHNVEGMGLAKLLNYRREDYTKVKGIGRVKSIQLECIVEICRRIWQSNARSRLNMNNAQSIAEYYMQDLRRMDVEQVHIMLFDVRGGLIRSSLISQGTVNISVVSPREIFKEAVRYSAAAIVMVHNHPSGIAEPSNEDIQFSRLVWNTGQMMNIPLLDSIIIGDNCFTSFAEKGILTP